MLAQLKQALNHHNPTKFVCHIATEQRRQTLAYGNHSSVAKNIPKVEPTLNKEERNKHVAFSHVGSNDSSQIFTSHRRALSAKEEKLTASSLTDPFWRLLSPPASINLRPKQTKLKSNKG